MSEINNIEKINQDFFKKSHKLVFSQIALSPVEADIFALLLNSIHKEQWDDYATSTGRSPVYKFSTQVLSEWFDISSKALYTTLYKPSARLAGKSIGIKDSENGQFKFNPLFKEISYKGGTLTIAPNELLMDEYLGVSQGHSQIPQKQFRKLKSEHSKRLYTILCRFKGETTKLHPQKIEELHAFFGLLNEKGELTKKSYKEVGIFIKRIIKPAIEEINNIDSDISFIIDEKSGNIGFTYHKKGNKITAIEFLYSWKKKEELKKLIKHPVDLDEHDALITLGEVTTKSRLPSYDELKNLQKHLKTLIFQGEAVPEEIIKTLKLLIEAELNM